MEIKECLINFFILNFSIYENYYKYKFTTILNIFNNNNGNFFILKLIIYTYNKFFIIIKKNKNNQLCNLFYLLI